MTTMPANDRNTPIIAGATIPPYKPESVAMFEQLATLEITE